MTTNGRNHIVILVHNQGNRLYSVVLIILMNSYGVQRAVYMKRFSFYDVSIEFGPILRYRYE